MAIFFAFFATYLSILLTIPFAEKVGLVDTPCQRKRHVGAIPLIGGLAIFLAVFISVMLFFPLDRTIISYLICAGAIVCLGVIDDYRQLGVKTRLAVQVAVALVMMWGSQTYISYLGNLFGFGEIELGIFGIPFTVIAVIAAINAFNMIDGIDGLAGSLSIVTFSSIVTLMFVNGAELTLLPLIIIATLLPYLAFNLGIKGHRSKKIFMGDAGSMFIGLSVIWLLMASTQSETTNAFSPVTALWIIAIPLMDMVAITFRRMRKGQSPFKADRDHLHHVFMRIGFSSRKALLTISLFSIFLACLGVGFEVLAVPDWLSLAIFMVVFSGYYYCVQHSWKVARYIRALSKNRS